MKVTQAAETITHTVIGGQEEEEFEIKNSAEFFQVLSDALYTNKPLATARETLCNAWDAHIEAGKEDTPLKVILSSEELIIQDFGEGIPDNLMKPLYGTYGGTTKVQNEFVTGGFGLGCKSPFSICDHFEVISCHKGVRSIWRISKSSGEVAGKPSVKKIVSAPTTDTGVTVKIPLSSKHLDRLHQKQRYSTLANSLDNAIRGVVYYGRMQVKYSYDYGNVEDKLLKTSKMPFKAFSAGFSSMPYAALGNQGVYLRYGNVIYPIPYDGYYQSFLADAEKVLGMVDDNFLILQAKSNSIAVAPSREALSLTDSTKDVIKELLKHFLKNFRKEARDVFEEIVRYNYENTDVYALMSNPSEILNVNELPGNYDPVKRKFVAEDGNDNFHTASADAVFQVLSGQAYSSRSRPDLMRMIGMSRFNESTLSLRKALESGLFNKQYMRDWIKISNYHTKDRYSLRRHDTKTNALRKYLRKNVFGRILHHVRKEIGDTKGTPRIYILNGSVEQDYSRYRPWPNNSAYIKPFADRFYPNPAMLRPVLILAHSTAKVEERYHYFPQYREYGSSTNTLLLTIPKKKNDPHYVSDMILMLNRLGYDVADLTTRQWFEPKHVFERIEKEQIARKRGSGFFTLLNYTQVFANIPEEDRIEKPRFFIRLERQYHGTLYDYLGLNTPQLYKFLPLLAKHTCVVWSDRDQKRAEKEGAKSLIPLIEKIILRAMQRNHDIRKVLKFIDYDDTPNIDVDYRKLRTTGDFTDMLLKHKILRKKYLNIPELPPEDEKLMGLIIALRQSRMRRAGHTIKLHCQHFSEKLNIKIGHVDSIPPSPKLVSISEKVSNSPIREVVDVGRINRSLLKNISTKTDVDRAYKLINFILQGK